MVTVGRAIRCYPSLPPGRTHRVELSLDTLLVGVAHIGPSAIGQLNLHICRAIEYAEGSLFWRDAHDFKYPACWILVHASLVEKSQQMGSLTMSETGGIYCNPTAHTWSLDHAHDFSYVQKFHQSLPDFAPSPLVSLPQLAKELGVEHIFIKDESARIGLPSFQILGASWRAFPAIAARRNLPLAVSWPDNAAAP